MLSEPFARRILTAAIFENRSAELFECLFNGGSATIDASTGTLALASAEMLAQLAGPDADPSPGDYWALPPTLGDRSVWCDCDWGDCSGKRVGLRYDGHEWYPVCAIHRDEPFEVDAEGQEGDHAD